MKIISKALLALFCLAMPLMAAADKRQVVTLRGATVADVICSDRDGRISFHVPWAPQFTSRGIFRSFPKGMTEYPALYKTQTGALTTAAMIRFINQSHTLFDSAKEQRKYISSLNECIAAHKAWLTKKSESNLATLHALEDSVLRKLKTLNLDDQEIRQQLESILSTPAEKKLNKIYNSLILPNRAWIAQDKNNEWVIKKSHPIWMIVKQSTASLSNLLGLLVFFVIHVWRSMVKEYPNFFNEDDEETKRCYTQWTKNHVSVPIMYSVFFLAAFILATKTLYQSASKSLTDFKLTPEPNHGIKVIIELTHHKAE